MLRVGCCLLVVVRGLVLVVFVCWLLYGVCRLVFVVCCLLLFVVACCSLLLLGVVSCM